VSNAAVSSDRGKNSFATLGLVASAPPPFPQRCDCAAKLWLLFLPVSVSSLHRLRSSSIRPSRGARTLFFEGTARVCACKESVT